MDLRYCPDCACLHHVCPDCGQAVYRHLERQRWWNLHDDGPHVCPAPVLLAQERECLCGARILQRDDGARLELDGRPHRCGRRARRPYPEQVSAPGTAVTGRRPRVKTVAL